MNNKEELYEYTILVTETREYRADVVAHSEEEARFIIDSQYEDGQLDPEFDYPEVEYTFL